MYERILVPLDGSDTSTHGLTEAIALAKLSGGSLRLLHVIDELRFASSLEGGVAFTPDMVKLLEEGGRKVLQAGSARAEAAGVRAQAELVEGHGRRLSEIVAEQVQAGDAQLIVIGTHGRRGIDRMLLGSDAENILRTANVPVLLVRRGG